VTGRFKTNLSQEGQDVFDLKKNKWRRHKLLTAPCKASLSSVFQRFVGFKAVSSFRNVFKVNKPSNRLWRLRHVMQRSHCES